MIYTNPELAAPAVAAALAPAQSILLLTHVNPDGDAIGSLLAAWHAVRAMGKAPLALASSALPGYARRLPGIEHVYVYQRGMALPPADLVWMLDTATLSRVGAIYDEHAAALAERKLLIVDHHLTNSGEGSVNLIVPAAASCAEVLYRLLVALQVPITPAIATCLLMGLVTDTQSFQTSSTRGESLRVGAELIDAGADQSLVTHDVYFAMPDSTARLLGLAFSRLQREGDLIWTVVTQEMLRETRAGDDASDDLIRMMQRIGDTRACALFKERFDGSVKISLRATPPVNVAQVAQLWGGGGHAQAAGATLMMDLAAAVQAVLPRLQEAIDGRVPESA